MRKYNTTFPDHVPLFNLINNAVAGLEGYDKLGGAEVLRKFSLEGI